MKLIEISQKDCVGCRLCEMVCSLSHEGECSTTRSRIKVLRDEEFGNNLVSVCLQCADPKCVEACASNVITRDEQTGIVQIDSEACIGCEICIDSCPMGAIAMDIKKSAAFKCDFCGGDPECVRFCSRKALTLVDADPGSPQRKAFMDENSVLIRQRRTVGI